MRFDVLVQLGHSLNALEDAEQGQRVWSEAMSRPGSCVIPSSSWRRSWATGTYTGHRLILDLVDCVDEVLELLDPGDSSTGDRPGRAECSESSQRRGDVPARRPDARRRGGRTWLAEPVTVGAGFYLRARLSVPVSTPTETGTRHDADELAALEPAGFDVFSRDSSAVLRELARANFGWAGGP